MPASGVVSSSSTAVISIPGVQKPHCRPCFSQNASCSGCMSSALPSPSMVRISAPAAWTASMRQERALSPLTSTVQAPQTPCSQPTWVPVSPRPSRRKSLSSVRGSHAAARRSPLTTSSTVRGVVMSTSLQWQREAASASARRVRLRTRSRR